MKQELSYQRIANNVAILLFFTVIISSCQEEIAQEQETTSSSAIKLPEGVLMHVSFESKTTSFAKPAEHMETENFDENTKHFLMTLAVPIIRKDRQTFRIFDDHTYELVTEILDPYENPAREAFWSESSMNDWELQKLVMDNNTITAYDVSGGVIFAGDNSGNAFFNTLVEKIFSDSYFAKHVNIGNALFRISGGAENYLDPKLKDFFVSPQAEIIKKDNFLIVKENLVESMRHRGTENMIAPANPNYGRRNLKSTEEPGTEEQNAAPSWEETMGAIDEKVEGWEAQKNIADINTYTAIDTTANKLAAEITYAGEEQVLSITYYEVSDDAQRTISTEYTQGFETDPVYDVDIMNKTSTEYSNVQIVNTFKNTENEND